MIGFSFYGEGGKMSKLGDGSRFKKLSKSLSKRKGIKNPSALAAAIGRKKFGSERMSNLSAMGRARAAEIRASKKRVKI